jgi:Aerotolerance regulator N-terminal
VLSFALPWLFGLSVAAAAVVAGLHLLSVRTPPELVLPTARFVPGGDARAVARRPRPNDVRLLLLRMAALLCAGAALAGVQWQSSRASTVRLVVADVDTPDSAAWRDSVEQALRANDAMVRVVYAAGVSRDPGAAMVAATRAAAQLAQRFRALSQVDLTVVVTAGAESPAGFDAWRAQWPGAVRVISRAARDTDSAAVDRAEPVVQVRVGRVNDDAVAAAFAGTTTISGVASAAAQSRRLVEVVRDNDDVSDDGNRNVSAPWTSVVTVQWPRRGLPTNWRAMKTPDTVGALVSGGLVLVGPWERQGKASDSLRAVLDTSVTTRALAWWSDGEVAAVERRRGTSCVREVAIVVPPGSDLLQSANARGLREALIAPCGGTGSETINAAGSNTPQASNDRPASMSAFRIKTGGAVGSDPWWLTPALLGAALLLLSAEWWWRRGEVAP